MFLIAMVVVLLAIPQTFFPIEKYAASNPSSVTAYILAATGSQLFHCGNIAQQCMSYNEANPQKRICPGLTFGRTHGWEEPGVDYHPVVGGIMRMSAVAYREVAYDPHLERFSDLLIALNTSLIPEEVRQFALPGVWPIVIQMNTDDPKRMKHRHFWAENLAALGDVADEKVAEFLVPRQFTKMDFRDFRAIFGVLAVNAFRQLFGIEVDWDPVELIEYRDAQMDFLAKGIITKGIQYKNAMIGKVMTMFMGNPAEVLAEKRGRLEAKIFSTEAAKHFIAEAHQQGIPDGHVELRHFVFGLFFAGLLGTPQTTESIILMILSDPNMYVPLFRADPEAFLLEAARHQPVVGGMVFNPKKERNFTVGGTVFTERPGDWGITQIGAHNMDPNVFGGPTKDAEYAQRFVPGRENADRLPNWNMELRDVRKCKSAAGCPDAPRPCPGIHLARRIIRQSIEFFIGGIEEEMRRSGHGKEL